MKHLGINGDFDGLLPAKYDKHGPLFSLDDVNTMLLTEAKNDELVQRRAKDMKKTVDEAISDIESIEAQFNRTFNSFLNSETKLVEQTKKACGNVRAAANDLANGLLKVQKGANFTALEHQVVLLERAAAALSTLADLDKQGRLDKIIGAMK